MRSNPSTVIGCTCATLIFPECIVSTGHCSPVTRIDIHADIRSRTKFRRLQQRADHALVSGLAKTGRPGVLVFQGNKESITAFLEGARSLRYLDFHHVATRPLDGHQYFAGPKPGLREVDDMGSVIQALEAVGLTDWFRYEMGMTSRPPPE